MRNNEFLIYKMKKHLFLAFALLVLSFITSYATSLVVSGNVSGVWQVDTVFVEGNIHIPQDAGLTIAPGTRIQFQSYYRIDAEGSLVAEGTLFDTILFTIHDTANFYFEDQGRGGWSGIRFRQTNPGADSSIFSYCRFEYGKATEDTLNCYGGAIFAQDFGKIRINNCLFFKNYSFHKGGAVYLHNANALIYNCTFQHGYSGNKTIGYGYGGGICSMNSSPDIHSNFFYDNKSTGVGGAVSFDNSDPIFINNIMEYNFSGLGGALGILRSTPTNTMSNNLVINNGCMFFGGGVCCIRSFPKLSNFTICNNVSAYGGGFYCNDSAAPSMYNSIIWDNSGLGASVYIWDVNSAPSFYHCNIMGDTAGFEGSGAHQGYKGEYLNNINTDPLLDIQMEPRYYPLPGSPCINTGTPDPGFLNLPPYDLDGMSRIWDFRIDMGAYEFALANIPKQIKSDKLTVFPNPSGEKFKFLFENPGNEKITINISSISGKLVRVIECYNTEIEWDGKSSANDNVDKGNYIATATINGKPYQSILIKL